MTGSGARGWVGLVAAAAGTLAGAMPAPSSAQSADTAAEAITIIGEAQAVGKAAPVVRIYQRGNCGSAANDYLCFEIVQRFAPEVSGARSTPALRFDAPGPGKAIVTWQGTVFCRAYPEVPPSGGLEWDIVVNAQVQNVVGGLPANGIGGATVGDYRTSTKSIPMFFSEPLTLTRTFAISGAGPQQFFLRANAEFRAAYYGGSPGPGVCRVSGGSMTALYVGQ